MSVTNIDIKTRLEILIRLICSKESFEDACSKSALSVQEAKKLLAKL